MLEFRHPAGKWCARASQYAPGTWVERLLAGGGMLAGIGFTMAWFIANLYFSQILIESKTGYFRHQLFP